MNHFTLAHLSDVHLGPLPRFPFRYWNAKRVLGYLNWHRGRKSGHLRPVLDRLVADLKAQRPDHIAVTGDLVNIGLPGEYIAAGQWLAELGNPGGVTVVPGNHDIYTRLADDPGYRRWAPYFAANAAGTAFLTPGRDGFPFVRCFGRVAIVGLNSAVPTRPFYSGGRLGTDQLSAAANILARLGADGFVRVVMIHHPPLPGLASPKKALEDAVALEKVLEAEGAELVLYGHNHRSRIEAISGPQNQIHVIGVTSASLGRHHKGEPLAGYHLFRFRGDGGPTEMVVRGLMEPGGPVVEIERRLLPPSWRVHRRA